VDKYCAMDIVREVKRTVVDTFHEISVHGFIFLVKRGNNILERVIWLFCICIGVYGIIVLGSDTWHRYQTSPTVITMDRSKFAWNTSFPSRE
jgi:amiloride-sensitive sodium channel